MERDGKTEEAAKRRLSAQLSNQEVIDHAHVVFSTLWEREFTQKQVTLGNNYDHVTINFLCTLGCKSMEQATGENSWHVKGMCNRVVNEMYG